MFTAGKGFLAQQLLFEDFFAVRMQRMFDDFCLEMLFLAFFKL
jgi:hypothetical protein